MWSVGFRVWRIWLRIRVPLRVSRVTPGQPITTFLLSSQPGRWAPAGGLPQFWAITGWCLAQPRNLGVVMRGGGTLVNRRKILLTTVVEFLSDISDSGVSQYRFVLTTLSKEERPREKPSGLFSQRRISLMGDFGQQKMVSNL